jgi:N-acetylmuramoyl-L-alanine amidase
MTARDMTRRSLLAATAGAVAGGLVSPGGALASLGRSSALGGVGEPTLFERDVGTVPAGRAGIMIDLRRNADLVGLRWSGPVTAHVELRVREPGMWSRWVSAGAHGHAPENVSPHVPMTGDPVWTGGRQIVQLRSEETLVDVRLSCVDVSDGSGARRQASGARYTALATALALATPTLPAGAGQPPIVARHAWAQGMAKPRVAPEYGGLQMAFVHHTDNPNGYSPGEVPAMLRAIYVFHRYVNDWNDIGYNFVIDLYGRIFEARAGGIDESVIGAHAGGYNYASTGVAVLGEFSSRPISAAAASALERLLAWKLSLHGIPTEGQVTVRVNPAGALYSRYPAGTRVSLPRIAGHRDGDSTDCPGDGLYAQLPGMRPRIKTLAGRVARASIALGAAATPPGVPAAPAGQSPPGGDASPGTPSESSEPAPVVPASQARTLMGSLTLLGGAADEAPLADAPILIQVREVARKGEVVNERTIAQVSTDVAGNWSLPVTLAPSAGGISLRALCPGASGAPAAVSAALHVPGAVSVA